MYLCLGPGFTRFIVLEWVLIQLSGCHESWQAVSLAFCRILEWTLFVVHGPARVRIALRVRVHEHRKLGSARSRFSPVKFDDELIVIQCIDTAREAGLSIFAVQQLLVNSNLCTSATGFEHPALSPGSRTYFTVSWPNPRSVSSFDPLSWLDYLGIWTSLWTLSNRTLRPAGSHQNSRSLHRLTLHRRLSHDWYRWSPTCSTCE
jgi:hypothetical protein